MKKKDIVTLALTAALLMTAHAVPVAAAESAAPNVTNNASTSYYSPMGKYKYGCSSYFDFW